MVLMSERVQTHSGATSVAFPPPIISGIAFVYVFHVSLPPPLGNAEGVLYIGVFRSRWASGDEDGLNQRLEAQTRLGGAAWLGARTT
jgi:hypothetical protein